MRCDNANEDVNELFDPLLLRYPIALETSMGGSDFLFDSVQPLYYNINFKRGGSFIDSPGWIKKEKSNNKSRK